MIKALKDIKLTRSVKWKILQATLIVVLVLCLAVGLYILFEPEIQRFIDYLQNEDIHFMVIIGAFIMLPLVGFPITALLVLMGMRFGVVIGILAMFSIMPLHLLFSFWLTRSFIGDRIKQYALKKEKDYKIFSIPEDRNMEFCFLFMVIPGLSYSMKNYLLPISGVPFRHYFFFGWLIQGIMGIPFVLLGEASAELNLPIFAVMAVIFVLLFVIMKWAKKRYQRVIEKGAG